MLGGHAPGGPRGQGVGRRAREGPGLRLGDGGGDDPPLGPGVVGVDDDAVGGGGELPRLHARRPGGGALAVHLPRHGEHKPLVAEDLRHKRRDAGAVEAGVGPVEEAGERGLKLGGAAVAILALLGQGLEHDLLQLWRQIRPLGPHVGDLGLAHLVEELERLLLLVEHLAADHLVEADPGAEHVGPGVDLITPGLLRRHVEELALDDPVLGLSAPLAGLGDAEVDDLDLAVIADEHVLGADVSMDDAERPPVVVHLGVGVMQARGQLHADEGDEIKGDRELKIGALDQDLVQVFAVDELHGDVIDVFDSPEIEGLADVHMGELDRDLGLIDQHVDELLVRAVFGVDHLEREQLLDGPHADGPRQMDLRHPADGDALDQVVLAELGALFEGRG